MVRSLLECILVEWLGLVSVDLLRTVFLTAPAKIDQKKALTIGHLNVVVRQGATPSFFAGLRIEGLV